MFALVLALGFVAGGRAAPAVKRPNFVWLHVESTDGRTYGDEMSGGDRPVVPIPRIRSLKDRGALFVNHYANVPICCPSRASVITGRQPHNLPHTHNGIQANGAWSNYEGFGLKNTTFDQHKIHDRLASQGCVRPYPTPLGRADALKRQPCPRQHHAATFPRVNACLCVILWRRHCAGTLST